jgi:K+/H+ antiporter YhaU regulatory subunit KhtT
MIDKKQDQSSGDNSQNLQAGRDIIISGLSYTEAKDLVKEEAQKVFIQNSLVLAEEAYKIVLERSKELLDNFLIKLEEKRPEAITSMKDPGMQYSLFNAQKEYSKTGDKDLASLLEDILVERAQNPKRDLMQIVLDECVSVAPKLTPDQFDSLSLIFIIRYTINYSITTFENLIVHIIQFILPFQNGIRKEQSRYQHLEFSSCGTIGIGTWSIEHAFRNNYMILFSKGFPIEEYEKISTDPKFKKFIMPCYHDKTKFQINIINQEEVKKIGKSHGLSDDEIMKINDLYNRFLMTEEEVKQYLFKLFPQIKSIIQAWNESAIKNMTLTSVGIAIGHANITRKTKQTFDLKIWIK